jgi:hypothetical protein
LVEEDGTCVPVVVQVRGIAHGYLMMVVYGARAWGVGKGGGVFSIPADATA